MSTVLKILGIIFGVLGIIGSAVSIRFSGITLVILAILQVLQIINIGWLMVFAYPLIMFFGGLFLLLISSLFAAFIAESI